MAIKGKWRIGGRKQSASSGENDGLSGTTSPNGSDGQDLTKTPSRFMRTLTGGFRSSKKKTYDPDVYGQMNRPFSQTNLEHQKVLRAFAWSSSKRKSSHGGRSNISGVSPTASRNVSVDASYLGPHPGDRRDTHPRFSRSFANEAPREVPGEESDGEQRRRP